jgi:hypothetical protein
MEAGQLAKLIRHKYTLSAIKDIIEPIARSRSVDEVCLFDHTPVASRFGEVC